MAITRAQIARELYIKGGVVNPDGRRGFFKGAEKDSREKGSNISPGTVGGNRNNNSSNNQTIQDYYDDQTNLTGKNVITDKGAQEAFKKNKSLLEAYNKAEAEEEKRRKEQEEEDEKRRKEEEKKARKEKRDARRKETKKEKRLRQMRQKAFERFQQIEGYVDPFGDETTFAGMSGEDAARLAGYNVNEFGPPGSVEFEYDKSRFRDPITGKIKSDLTEKVNINEGKTDIFGRPKKPKFVEQFKSDAIPGYDFSINPVKNNFQSGLGTLTSTGSTTKVRPNDYGIQIPTGTSLDILSGIVRPEDGLQAFNTLEEARNIGDVTTRYAGGDDSAYDDYLEIIDRTNPTTSGSGDGNQQTDPCKGPNPPAYCNVGNDDDQDPTQILTSRILGSQFDPTFFANEGGRAELAEGGMPYEGGIMDLESGRQMYFLGKLVKKATRAVKKIAKSPIGKAAILGGLAYFGGGGGLPKFLNGTGLGGFSTKTLFSKANPLLFTDGKFSMGKFGLLSAATPFLFPEEENNNDDLARYLASQELTPGTTKRQMGSEFDFYNYNLAEGGMPSKEPVAKKTMPLIDMDGQEMDLRAEGGFVPIGRMERADDVPARLSKNEFVFTADAVRNAGEGDIDKGAEVMYNMMKNLESGGEVSEESQGLDGAREMFQTSKRLEEVL